VLITGASSGIGYATALAFAKRGAHVVVTARRSDRLAELQRVITLLPQPHGDSLAVSADVSDAEAMQQAVAQAVARFGRLDVLIANAGVGQRGALVDAPWEDLQAVLSTNIDGVLHTIRAAIPALRQAGNGHIVIVSSVAGMTATPYTAVYGASKAFVSSLARSLAFELEEDRITVTNLLIGPTSTEFNQSRRGGARSENATSLPTMTPDQVAEGIVRAAEQRTRTAVLRPFDRFILLLNTIAPRFIGRQALKRYKPG
jgi:short-subunit dehydrogenase